MGLLGLRQMDVESSTQPVGILPERVCVGPVGAMLAGLVNGDHIGECLSRRNPAAGKLIRAGKWLNTLEGLPLGYTHGAVHPCC